MLEATSSEEKTTGVVDDEEEKRKMLSIFRDESGKNDDWNKKYIHSSLFLLGCGAYGSVFQKRIKSGTAGQNEGSPIRDDRLFGYRGGLNTKYCEQSSPGRTGASKGFFYSLRREFLIMDTIWRKISSLNVVGFRDVVFNAYLYERVLPWSLVERGGFIGALVGENAVNESAKWNLVNNMKKTCSWWANRQKRRSLWLKASTSNVSKGYMSIRKVLLQIFDLPGHLEESPHIGGQRTARAYMETRQRTSNYPTYTWDRQNLPLGVGTENHDREMLQSRSGLLKKSPRAAGQNGRVTTIHDHQPLQPHGGGAPRPLVSCRLYLMDDASGAAVVHDTDHPEDATPGAKPLKHLLSTLAQLTSLDPGLRQRSVPDRPLMIGAGLRLGQAEPRPERDQLRAYDRRRDSLVPKNKRPEAHRAWPRHHEAELTQRHLARCPMQPVARANAAVAAEAAKLSKSPRQYSPSQAEQAAAS
uniref:Protein kinase domain-containing protein n=1 Tax=Macrostomum lignano TaxID=282301 RepID=A0A1I8FNG8_9PLAT